MAKTINLLEQKFFSEFKNGVDFTDNIGDFTRNLTGSILEGIKFTCKIEIKWRVEYVAQGGQINAFEWKLDFNGDILTVTRTDGEDFRSEGFGVGQLVRWRSFTNQQYQQDATIVSINESTIILDMNGTTSLPFDPAGIQIIGLSPLTALIFDYGLIENDENYNNISKVTQDSMSFYGVNIGENIGGNRQTNWIDLEKRGLFSDFVTGTMRAKWIETVDSIEEVIQRFEIEHIFRLNPFSTESSISDIINKIPPEYLNGDASLKYVFNANFREVLNNPNVSYSYKEEDTLGSTAWFNEAFNGFNNNYKIDSISYVDNATNGNADGVLIDGVTKVKVSVSKIAGSFVVGYRYGVYSFVLENEQGYIDTDSNMIENFIYDRSLGIQDSNTYIGSDYIKSMTSSINSGVLEIEFTLEFSTEQKKRVSELKSSGDDLFLIGIQIGDKSLPSGNSDRLILLADVGNFDESADISGLASIVNHGIYPPNQNINGGESYTDYSGWNEDGLLSFMEISINKQKQAFINSIEVKLIAFNPTTKDYFDLDSILIPFVSQNINGIEVITVDETRNYNLKNGSQFNFVKISNTTSTAINENYLIEIGQKIKWQDWIANPDVNNVFYDALKKNDNKNLKSSNYSELNGYEIRIASLMNIFGVSDLGVSGDTDYLFTTPKIVVYDYEKDFNILPEWTCEIETFRESNNENLLGQILTGENTIMKATWTNTINPVVTTNGIWAIHRIEQTDQTGDDIDELSSTFDPMANQRLIPLVGETLLKVELVSGKIVTSSLIDGNRLSEGAAYNLTARINNSSQITQETKVTSPLGEEKETSGVVESKIISNDNS